MVLLGLAVIGKANDPLYLCDCEKYINPHLMNEEPKTGGDAYGFEDTREKMGISKSMKLEHQFLVHSALDILEEKCGPANSDGTMSLRRGVDGNAPVTSRWAGILFQENDLQVMGHVTATSVKIIAVVRESRHEAHLKILLASIHMAYIQYVMNPIGQIEKLDEREIRSPRFDKNVRIAIQEFCNKINSKY